MGLCFHTPYAHPGFVCCNKKIEKGETVNQIISILIGIIVIIVLIYIITTLL